MTFYPVKILKPYFCGLVEIKRIGSEELLSRHRKEIEPAVEELRQALDYFDEIPGDRIGFTEREDRRLRTAYRQRNSAALKAVASEMECSLATLHLRAKALGLRFNPRREY